MNPDRTIDFPVGINFPKASTIDPPVVTTPMSSSAPARKLTSSERILIAEDDPVSCQVLATRLQKLGYEPLITHDGLEAMTAMRAVNAPALAIIDWMMPGMDGMEVCRRLREIDKVVYIIFLTARGAKENIFEALQAGADDYLVKPFDPLELQGRIHVGFRIINLQKELTNRLAQLAATVQDLDVIKTRLTMPL
jgi:DNA-binding response OmpR family regulator